MCKKKWRFIGHILRKENEDTKIAMTWAPEGKRKRRRPKENWRRTSERERNAMGWSSWKEVETEARDRSKWRSLLPALCSIRSSEDEEDGGFRIISRTAHENNFVLR